jgi:predicted nuclease with TOPRIM domain
MSLSPNFLTQFQTKMDALTNERSRVQKTIQDRQQFTSDLKTKLGQIYQRLQILANLINQLKTKATTLETQITTNASDIGKNQGEIERLQSLMNKEAQLKGDLLKEKTTLESKVRDYEEQIKTLNAKSITLETEIKNRGDPAAHAAAIKELTQGFELEKSKLLLQLNAANSKIAQLEEQKRQIDQAQTTNQGQVKTLQEQIDQLKAENKDLLSKLIAAIKAIQDATADLKTLMDTVPNAQTKQEVDQLLGQITQQIEGSITDLQNTSQTTTNTSSPSVAASIYGSMFGSKPQANNPLANVTRNGQTVGQSGSQNNNSIISSTGLGLGFGRGNNNPNIGSNPLATGALTDATRIPIFPGDPNPLTLGEIKAKLRAKMAEKKGLDPNLASAWNDINNNAKTASDVAKMLNDRKINLTISSLGRGGKKTKRTKKNKKQKGGFTYKKKFRRSGITSNSRYNRSSKSKRSSR